MIVINTKKLAIFIFNQNLSFKAD